MSKELKFYHPEFERVVRDELLVSNRQITDEDALNVFDLDCSDFTFDSRDYEFLSAFKNIDWLTIKTRADELDFLKELPLIEELNLEICGVNNTADFNHFSHLVYLRELTVSGDDVSSIDYKNLEGLIGLKNLDCLTLRKFGTVDLRPLRSMPWIKGLDCGYGKEVIDIDAIATLRDLEALTLIDVEMDNLNFLDNFSDSLIVGLYRIRVKQGIDCSKLSRFTEGDFDKNRIEEG